MDVVVGLTLDARKRKAEEGREQRERSVITNRTSPLSLGLPVGKPIIKRDV